MVRKSYLLELLILVQVGPCRRVINLVFEVSPPELRFCSTALVCGVSVSMHNFDIV